MAKEVTVDTKKDVMEAIEKHPEKDGTLFKQLQRVRTQLSVISLNNSEFDSQKSVLE